MENASDVHPASGVPAIKERASTSTSTACTEAGASCTASDPLIHSQIVVPLDSQLFGSDGVGCIGCFVNDSPNVGSQQADDDIRGSAQNLLQVLSNQGCMVQKNMVHHYLILTMISSL